MQRFSKVAKFRQIWSHCSHVYLGKKPFRGRINLTAASSVSMKTIRIKSPNKNVETFKLRMLLGIFQGLN